MMFFALLGAAVGFLYNGIPGAAWGTVVGATLAMVLVALARDDV